MAWNSREYYRRYYQKNKEKINEANKRYRKAHPEKFREYARKYRQSHPEVMRQAYEKFKATHDWSAYCSETRRRRVERLRAQGVRNAWAVVTQNAEPKYERR